MNTPEPCDKCKHLYWDCMREDDPSYEAECKKNLKMGNKKCKGYKKYNANIQTS